MLWSMKSWYLACGIVYMPCRIGTSGLLVKKTRNRTVFINRALARSPRMIRTFWSPLHSSSASIIRTYDWWDCSSLDRGWRISWRHWSERDNFATSRRSMTASQTCFRRDGIDLASCTARLVKNLPAWLTSPPPFEKKKLAPRRFCSLHLRATVREIVDFPVPARPFSQKMHCSFCLSFPSAQLYICCRRSTRVPGRQAGSCWRL